MPGTELNKGSQAVSAALAILLVIAGGLLFGACFALFLSLLAAIGLVLALVSAFIVAPLAGATYAVIAVPGYGVMCTAVTSFGFATFRIPDGPEYTTFLTSGQCAGRTPVKSVAVMSIGSPWEGWHTGWIDDLFSRIFDRGIDMFWVGVDYAMPYMQAMHDIPVLGAIYWTVYTIVILFASQILIKAAGDLYSSLK